MWWQFATWLFEFDTDLAPARTLARYPANSNTRAHRKDDSRRNVEHDDGMRLLPGVGMVFLIPTGHLPSTSRVEGSSKHQNDTQ